MCFDNDEVVLRVVVKTYEALKAYIVDAPTKEHLVNTVVEAIRQCPEFC